MADKWQKLGLQCVRVRVVGLRVYNVSVCVCQSHHGLGLRVRVMVRVVGLHMYCLSVCLSGPSHGVL